MEKGPFASLTRQSNRTHISCFTDGLSESPKQYQERRSPKDTQNNPPADDEARTATIVAEFQVSEFVIPVRGRWVLCFRRSNVRHRHGLQRRKFKRRFHCARRQLQ